MADAGNGSVQLLEADPELARGLDPRRVREVSQRLFARAIDVPRGTWSPGRALGGGSQPIGLLVLEGLLVREAIVGDHPCAELLGPGDLIRVPRGTHHWFDLCADRNIRAIRLFQDVSGWTPQYTETGVDRRYEPVCLGPAYLPRGA